MIFMSDSPAGNVVLRNLKLKPDALKPLELPINMAYGKLGTLILKIPWKNIYTQPIVITMENVYVLATPNTDELPYNAARAEQAERDDKRERLSKLDEKRERRRTETPADKTLVEKFVAKTINNLQLHFKNIHIRYEDTVTSAVTMTAGVTLGELSVFSTDAEWGQTYRTTVPNRMFKLAKLDGLALYVNCDRGVLFKDQPVRLYEALFAQSIARLEKRPKGYSYGMVIDADLFDQDF